MFGSAHSLPKTSTSQTLSSDSASTAVPECSDEAMLNEQALSFTTTDLNIVEMTEIEYTQLQQILYSHMDTQTNEGEMETKINSSYFPASNSSSVPQHQCTSMTNQSSFATSSSGGKNIRPVVCQSAVSSESNIMSSNQTSGHVDYQELRMMMLSESNMPLTSGNTAEKTPSTGGDTSGAGTERERAAGNVAGMNKENENLAHTSDSRLKSAVRVRLEDRFNCIQTEMPRCQETQEPGVTLNNSLVTLIRHPSQLIGAQQQNKCAALIKSKASAATASLQFTYPGIGLQNAAPSGNPCSSQAQANSSVSCGNPCPMLEAAKQQEMSVPRTFSFCYQQEIESTKRTLAARNKSLPEQVWIKVGGTLCKQAINKRSRGRVHQGDAITERKALSDIQNLVEKEPVGWPAAKSNTAEPAPNEKPGGSSQRREKHNRMERDRRRRIRICCDELNHLVPFCNMDTDKATTLQWTTAFLKYIQERDGDSLKKEFESVFCGKTGRRLKVPRSESVRTGQAQEMALSSSLQDVK